jgi:hypothetical protein
MEKILIKAWSVMMEIWSTETDAAQIVKLSSDSSVAIQKGERGMIVPKYAEMV